MDEIEYDWAITLAQLWDDPNHDNFECGWDWKNAYEHRRNTHDDTGDNGRVGGSSQGDEPTTQKGSMDSV